MNRVVIFHILFYFCNSVSIPKVGEEKEFSDLRNFFSGRSIKSDETDSIIEILKDIKSTIQDKNNSALSKQWEAKFESMTDQYDEAIADLKEQFDKLSINTKQKVDIMIENISTLRMLLVEQGEQIKMVLERIENIEDGAMPNGEKSTVDLSPQRPLANFIQYSDFKPLNSHLISDILSVNPKSPQIKPLISELIKKKSDTLIKQEEKDTVESLTEKVNQLRSAVTLLNVNSGAHDVQITELLKSSENLTKRTESQNVCSCPNETFEKILKSINSEFAKVQDSRNFIQNYQKEIEDFKLQIQSMERGYKAISKNVSDVELELSQLKLSRFDLLSPSSDITNMKDQLEVVSKTLNKVIKMVETEKPSPNDTTVLCVHPYKRKADGCYHVINDRRLSWKEARTACKDIQGDLAAPKNFTKFRNHLLDLKLSRSYTFWIGGSDEAVEDKWVWVNGREVNMNEEVWVSGQPNQGKSNNCMEVRPTVRYVASDQRCEIRKHFICQQIGS